ncbi:hypothetical protein L5515_010671 [Caenorhabditis briggsae]|uniref:CCHC-type domain-containing protein n=1 Tax=Caenorhabditis briggsae TaxID=6238 RepID=A0AAE9JFE3_CAEBR|nr:hypothetical protein L5515_010671 [Caenorhabditis briggsae]
MSEVSSEAAPLKLMDRDSYYRTRAVNPWPTPVNENAGGGFRKIGGLSGQPKKFGGGFGATASDSLSSTPRGGAEKTSSFDNFSGFVRTQSSAFGSRIKPLATEESLMSNKERIATPTPTVNVLGVPRTFGGPSPGISPTKRTRSGRRSGGRRGRGGPGHCFHCQEHGHISRLCPKKTVDTDDFDEVEASRFLDDEVLAEAPKKGNGSLISGKDVSLQNAKLGSQMSRSSYYRGFGYGNTTPINTTSVNNNTLKSVSTNARATPDIDKFSEQLDNALKLPVKPAPAELSSTLAKGRTNTKIEAAAPIKAASPAVRDKIKEPSSTETMSIETRRTVTIEGDTQFEETTVISFPCVLPPNVRVITAQFVPVSSAQVSSANEIQGNHIKEKF